MELTYFTSGGSGDAGDQYTGLDRFGRVVDQRWDEGGVDVERVKYGYDRVSNQIWRQNTVAVTGQDEFYTQDGLYQLKTLQRGTLNGSKTGISGTPSWEEDWNFDPLGNWHGPSSGYETKVTGAVTLNQNRSHSQANEIRGITTGSGPAWTVPVHDAAGNMTRAPQPYAPASGYDLMYDAWNRLVQVQVTGGALVATYAYDGASRRVSKTNGGTVRHYFYDDQWRVVEERVNASVLAERRFTWGIRRLDDLILRDRILPGMGSIYSSSSGSSSSSGPTTERLYAVDDAKNVTGVVSPGGTVRERYGYNGFGGVRYMNASFGSITASAHDWETLFSSYRHDSESGLYQVRFRYLHPLLGRWTSRDPITEPVFELLRAPLILIFADGPSYDWSNPTPTQEQGSVNLYAYVGNEPINEIDPLGLQNWIGPGYGALPTPGLNNRSSGSGSGSDGQCCENDKVPIWICNRKLESPNSIWPRIGPLSHSFVACIDPATHTRKEMINHAFGKQPHESGGGWPFWGPGYILPEFPEFILTNPNEFKHCKKKMVCPDEQKYLCPGAAEKAKSFYFMLSPFDIGGNCHNSANGGFCFWPH